LDKNQRIFLYKAVKELLINIVKHANARSVKVSISAADGNVIISVKDDGKGFDVNDEEKLHFDRYHGFGLFSIRERLVDFAGALEVNSDIGKGTEIVITMPLN
jgi:signal transduction histidine kinase